MVGGGDVRSQFTEELQFDMFLKRIPLLARHFAAVK